MTRRSYVTATLVAELAGSLTEREQAVVGTLDRLRLATTSQLERLHFTGGTVAANTRQARRTLRRLRSECVLTTLERRVGGGKRGSSQAVYALDVAGQKLASMAGPAGGSRLRSPWTPKLPFVAHQLAVTEAFVTLTEAARTGRFDLLAFDAEPLCWRRFTGVGGVTVTLKPDAFFRVGLGDYEDSYFLEVDMGTEPRSAITRKLDAYRRYRQSGREERRWGVFPQLLFLAGSDARGEALRGFVAQPAGEAGELCAVELAARLGEFVAGGTS